MEKVPNMNSSIVTHRNSFQSFVFLSTVLAIVDTRKELIGKGKTYVFNSLAVLLIKSVHATQKRNTHRFGPSDGWSQNDRRSTSRNSSSHAHGAGALPNVAANCNDCIASSSEVSLQTPPGVAEASHDIERLPSIIRNRFGLLACRRRRKVVVIVPFISCSATRNGRP